MKVYTNSRRIEIDAGHRVPEHGSKCKNLHGHRYVIEAICESRGGLIKEGEQRDMILDFGFMKSIMMDHIDAPCDHGMILRVDDPYLPAFIIPSAFDGICHHVHEDGYAQVGGTMGKLYVVPFSPTAERLAEHWYGRMKDDVTTMSDSQSRLVSVKVWETPNCWAIYESKDT